MNWSRRLRLSDYIFGGIDVVYSSGDISVSESVVLHVETTTEDYPAAHSMDSEWFAVDAHGNVGVFDTGEAGVCPAFAVVSQDVELIEEMLAAGFDYNADAIVASEPGWSQNGTPSEKRDWLQSVWMETSSGNVKLVPETDAKVLWVPHPDLTMFYTSYMSSANLRKLVKDGKVLRAWTDQPMEYQGFGIFHYSCEDYGFGEPYDLMDKPSLAVKLAQLPPNIRERFEAVKFVDLNFDNETQVYPRRYFQCFGWGTDE